MTAKRTKNKKQKAAADVPAGEPRQAAKHQSALKHRARMSAKKVTTKTGAVAKRHVATKPRNPVAFIRRRIFGRLYVVGAGALLFATSAYGAFQSALLQQGNADQLVNTYMVQNAAVFRGAEFPDQHTFLIKWPLFFLVHLCGSNGAAFAVWTVVVTLLTVTALAYILYRIDRRPLVVGTLWLAMASVLLLVPAQPYPGGILPVSMAMLTTRNMEYVLYIIGLILVARTTRWRQWSLGAAAVVFTLLIASDKFFMSLGVGGALLTGAACMVGRRREWLPVVLRWLATEVAATVAAFVLIAAINMAKVTHIVGETVGSPYAFVQSVREIALGGVYAILAVLTNFGANPALDSRLLWKVPAQVRDTFLGVQGIAVAVNMALLLGGLWAVCMVIRASLFAKKRALADNARPLAVRSIVAVALCATSVVAVAEFVFTKHYYPVDARYVTIVFFAVFVSLAVYVAGSRRIRPELLVVTGGVILLGIAVGLGVATRTFTAEQSALADLNARNARIAEALKLHPVNTLLADYWRAFPSRLAAQNQLVVTPLEGCTQPRKVLSSAAWRPDLKTHSFAYLLELEPSITGFGPCSEAAVEAAYGVPSESVLVSGTLGRPRELLLFYDQGAHHSRTKAGPAISTAITPIQLHDLSGGTCVGAPSMNIVAHQDDDLLFMNPDTMNGILAGECVRTVYVTAGDAGRHRMYWQERQQGVEAAYATMFDVPNRWVHRPVEVLPGHYATFAQLQGNNRVSLVFMNLPDGNMHGEGFRATRFQSVERLEKGRVSSVRTVDGQSQYTLEQLQAALAALMQAYKPEIVRVQSDDPSPVFPDHSDHRAVGRIASRAYQQYVQNTPSISTASLLYYMGYPIHALQPNLGEESLLRKETAFFVYGRYDGSVCDSAHLCAENPTYQAYLERQYTNDH